MKAFLLSGCMALALLASLAPAGAQLPNQYQQLMFFDSARSPGANPTAGLVFGKDGFLYGTTATGGAGGGAVIAISTNGANHRVVHSFGRGQGFAVSLGRMAVGIDGVLYGTAQSGGTGSGMVFKVNPDGSGFQVLHSFGSVPNDGYNVLAGLAMTGGALFGVTEDDFTTNRAGIIFKVNLDGSSYQILHQFTTNVVNGAAVDGSNPFAGLIVGRDGALYGTTRSGGSTINFPYGPGSVYKINPDGGGYAVLHSFSFGDGYAVSTELIQAIDGTLFGTTAFGGLADSGLVFQLNTNGGGFSVVYSFSNIPGGGASVQPSSLVQGVDGTLYGTTAFGGVTNSIYTHGMGTAFKMNPDGNGYAVLHTFGGEDGVNPQAALAQGNDGTLYGTTQFGGFLDQGTIIKLATAPIATFAIIDKIYGPGGFQLTISGVPTANLNISTKSDLGLAGAWPSLLSTNTDANGLLQFTDSDSTNHSYRFYQIIPGP